MAVEPAPRFLDAYLVATGPGDETVVGVVRKSGNVWRIIRFGVPEREQSREAFATRIDAGRRPIELTRD